MHDRAGQVGPLEVGAGEIRPMKISAEKLGVAQIDHVVGVVARVASPDDRQRRLNVPGRRRQQPLSSRAAPVVAAWQARRHDR